MLCWRRDEHISISVEEQSLEADIKQDRVARNTQKRKEASHFVPGPRSLAEGARSLTALSLLVSMASRYGAVPCPPVPAFLPLLEAGDQGTHRAHHISIRPSPKTAHLPLSTAPLPSLLLLLPLLIHPIFLSSFLYLHLLLPPLSSPAPRIQLGSPLIHRLLLYFCSQAD